MDPSSFPSWADRAFEFLLWLYTCSITSGEPTVFRKRALMVNVTTLMIAKGVFLFQDQTIKINTLHINISNQRTACEREHEVNSFLLDDVGVPDAHTSL